MYGYVYLTTNNVNGKQYIGQHISETFDKNYKGSGKLIRQAFKKYGKRNFSTIILEECNSQEELNKKEKDWILYYKADESNNFYNISNGGASGFGGLVGDKNPAKRPSVRQKMSENHCDVSKENNPNYGKKMSDEQRQKISQSRIQRKIAVGEKNPMYGKRGKDNPNYNTVCINKDGITKKVKKEYLEYYLNNGWIIGTGRIKITDGKGFKRINKTSIDKYPGWKVVNENDKI